MSGIDSSTRLSDLADDFNIRYIAYKRKENLHTRRFSQREKRVFSQQDEIGSLLNVDEIAVDTHTKQTLLKLKEIEMN